MSEQRILGKAPPESSELQKAADAGFEAVELYLEEKHLERMSQSADAVNESEVAVESVHTPHMARDELEYLTLTDDFAQEIDADYMVIHPGAIPTNDVAGIEREFEFETPHGYESGMGESLHFIENAILDHEEVDMEFVFDVAHVYGGTPAYRRVVRTLLTEPHVNSIGLIHFCDSTATDDGLAIGEGDIDVEWLADQIRREYDGPVVLEVNGEDQAAALDFWKSNEENSQEESGETESE